MYSVSILVVVAFALAAVSLASSSVSKDCPCYASNGNSSYMICGNSSLKTIPDCVSSSTVRISIRTPSISLVPKTIRRFTNLQILHVEYFEKPEISKAFLGGQMNLVFFQIYDTSLEYVDKEWFKYAPSIRTLVISKNKISYLAPDVFRYLPNLETLSMYRNRLSSISTAHFVGINLKVLYYHDNPWQCDCDVANFMQWARTSKVAIRDKAVCSHPMHLEGVDLMDLSPALACIK